MTLDFLFCKRHRRHRILRVKMESERYNFKNEGVRFIFIVNKRYEWIVASSGGLSPLRQQLKLILRS